VPQRQLSQEQVSAVLSLAGPERYNHFIKQVVGWRVSWGLWSDGWAVAESNTSSALPLWPAKEYARLCATGEWDRYSPKEIEITHLINVLLPNLAEQGDEVSVFSTPLDRSVFVNPLVLIEDLQTEMERYSD
jgi:hypothetical protein